MTPWTAAWSLLLLAVSMVVVVAGVLFSAEPWGVAMMVAGAASAALCGIGLVLGQAVIAFLGSLASGCGGMVFAALAEPTSAWASPVLTAGLLGLVGLGLLGATRMIATVQGRERTHRIATLLQEVHETSMLSDLAKRILYRDREMDLIRSAIEEDIERGDYNSGLVLCSDLERLFGYTDAAEHLRQRVLLARNSQLAASISEELAAVTAMLDEGRVQDAEAAGKRLHRVYPDTPGVHGLDARIRSAKLQMRRELRAEFLQAAERGDTRRAMTLLRELDHQMSPEEAAEIQSVAEQTVARHREALSARFKMAVSDHRWLEAVAAGEEIVEEFPNDRMAAEVREMLDRLKVRASAEEEEDA
ncbi:MAG: hypothetical protein QF733_06600 [Phycisphaerales bacterium]|jgi:hypothetical protein|nr:hypothetical protein [Phycisphaerales bacterium]